MKHPLIAVFIVLMLLAGVLSACNLAPPTCMPDEMIAPLQGAPGDWLYSRLTVREDHDPPLFTWSYQGTCMPDEYRIIVSRATSMPHDPFFEYLDLVVLDTRTTGGIGATIIYEDGRMANAFSFMPDTAFGTGTYYWRVIPYNGSIHGEYSEWKPFRIGPVCTSVEEYTIPARLIYPSYGRSVPGGTITFSWLDDNSCVLGGTFQVEVSEYTTFPEEDTYILPRVGGTIWTEATGTLNACTQYYWRVTTLLPGEIGIPDIGPISEVFMFTTSNRDGSACEGPAPTPTSAAASGAFANPMEPINCRLGPTVEYPILNILSARTQYEIRGRSTEGDSWLVFDPAINNTCWIFGDLVDVIGDTRGVQTVIPDPPSTSLPDEPTAVNCSQWSANQPACIANPACTWQPNLHPESPCVNK